MLNTHAEFQKKIEAMEAKYDKQFRVVFDAIKQILKDDDKPKRKINF